MNFVTFLRTSFSRTPPVAKADRIAGNFFTEGTGNRVSDHYARDVYIKVFP